MNLHEVTFPNGSPGTHAVVHTATDHGAVIVPLVISRGMVYLGLVRQHRVVLGTDSLEFPRGRTDDLSEAEALREVLEELGEAPRRMDQVGLIHPDSGFTPVRAGVWLALMNDSIMQSPYVEEETGLSMNWVTECEFLGLIHRGEMNCSMSLAAYSLWGTNKKRYGSLLR